MDHFIEYVRSQLRSRGHFNLLTDQQLDQVYLHWQNRETLFSFFEYICAHYSTLFAQDLYHAFQEAEKVYQYKKDHDQQNEKPSKIKCFYYLCLNTAELDLLHKILYSCYAKQFDTNQIQHILKIFRITQNQLTKNIIQSIGSESFQWSEETHLVFHPPTNTICNATFTDSYDHVSMEMKELENSIYIEGTSPHFISQHYESHTLTPIEHSFFEQITPHLHTSKLSKLCNFHTPNLNQVIQAHYQQTDLWHTAQVSFTQEEKTSIWYDYILPALQETCVAHICTQLSTLCLEIVKPYFTRLIDARRPHYRKIASVYFSGDLYEKITVVFLNRNGNLLAQRNYTWNPNQTHSLVQALVEVNVASLVIPQWIPRSLCTAIDHLKSYYQIHYVAPIALDPVTRPLNLTVAAQKAIRLGQRYVAPLRYWPRMDSEAFLSYLLPSEIYDFLVTHDQVERMQDIIQWESAVRWIHLRRDRNKKQHQSKNIEQSKAEKKTTAFHSSFIQTDQNQVCWVTVIGLTPHLIQVKTIRENVEGSLDIKSLASVGLSLGDLSLYQEYPVCIQLFDPKKQKPIFYLDSKIFQSYYRPSTKDVSHGKQSFLNNPTMTSKKHKKRNTKKK